MVWNLRKMYFCLPRVHAAKCTKLKIFYTQHLHQKTSTCFFQNFISSSSLGRVATKQEMVMR